MQKDKAEKFYLTKRKLQMRKTAKLTDYFPGNRDCMRKKQSPPQKTAAILKKKIQKGFPAFKTYFPNKSLCVPVRASVSTRTSFSIR